MIFLHISDLHIGKSVNDFSMLEEQAYILNQIQEIAGVNHADAVVIAGDVYDRAIPAGEAVTLFDSFLTGLAEKKIQTVLISGNHDSPERLSFGEALLGRQGVHIAGLMKDGPAVVEFREKAQSCPDQDVVTEFVMLPFIKPAQAEAANSGEAVKKMLDSYWSRDCRQSGKRNEARRNRVLVTHFFVTDGGREPELSDSEATIHVGGLDNVDVSLFAGFDYTALGHIHKPQQIGSYPVWYAGAPLKYSFGEVSQTKCALLVTMGEAGLGEVRQVPLRPRREFRKITGTLKELLEKGQEEREGKQDYIQAILTDQGELIDPMGTLRSVYPNMMQILRQTEADAGSKEAFALTTSRKLAEKKDALALFENFYLEVRGEELSEEGRRIAEDAVRHVET